ncbi:MAG: hypothetical protein AAFN93_12600, partial [Bacteroidota bacterium]
MRIDMKNKWTLTDNTVLIKYNFPSEGKESYYLDLLRKLITIGEQSRMLVLESSEDRYSPPLIDSYFGFISELHSNNQHNLFPRVLKSGVYDIGNKEFSKYYFSSYLFVYNVEGKIVEKKINAYNLLTVLKDIHHPLAEKSGYFEPLDFEVYFNLNSERKISSYDFTLKLNSDLWADLVPCPHCPRGFTNEEIRKEGWEARMKYWHDNRELAYLNAERLNDFMKLMLDFTYKQGGDFELNDVDSSIYDGVL